MAAREVIHFLLRAQLASRRLFSTLTQPESVAESPP